MTNTPSNLLNPMWLCYDRIFARKQFSFGSFSAIFGSYQQRKWYTRIITRTLLKIVTSLNKIKNPFLEGNYTKIRFHLKLRMSSCA